MKLRAPSKIRRRVLYFVAALAIAIGILQWSGLPTVLDNLLGGLEWSKSVVAFLKANTQGLIIIAILTLFFEFIGFDRSRETERKEAAQIRELLNDAISSSTGAALARTGLRREYGDTAGRQLSSMITHNQILKDVSVRISISKQEQNVVIARTRLSYQCDTDKFVVAFVTDPLAIPVLNTAMPELNEILVVSPNQLTAEPGTPAAAVSVSVIAKHASRERRASLKFTALSDKKVAAVLRKGGASAVGFGCKVFEADPANDLGLNQKEITDLRFTIEYEVEVDDDFPYTFWTADRPLHIREIEVDIRGLPQAQRIGAKVQLHLGSVPWTNVPSSGAGVWHFPVDSWAVNGQGVFVLWRRA